MHTPRHLETAAPFHVGSFGPAVSLTEDLPQGVDADILLLGCGDARHMLYTLFTEKGLPERKLDFTACDVDENVIARNVLLFTVLLDNDANVSMQQIWNIYYHFYLEDPDLAIVRNQAKKLAGISQSLKDWHASPYGATLRFCDEKTLSLVRDVWAHYADTTRIEAHFGHNHWELFWDRLREARQNQSLKARPACAKDVSRSCAPLAMQVADDLLHATEQHWTRGIAGFYQNPELREDDQSKIPNPMFAIPLMGSAALQYPTDPLTSFHLAAARANLTELSPLRLDEKPPNGPNNFDDRHRLLEMALLQFKEWAGAFVGSASRTTIRFSASECFAFGYTLRHNLATGETCAHWYRGKVGFDALKLAESEYGAGGQAPKQFDVIDTSTLSDDTSILNLLVSLRPLLKDAPSSTLYTEGLQRLSRAENLDKLLYGHTTTISALIGLVPAEYWTNAKAVSLADQILTGWSDEKAGAEVKDTIFGFRLSWKQTWHLAGLQSDVPLHARIDDLVRLGEVLYNRLLRVSPSERPAEPLEQKSVIPKRMPCLQHYPGTMMAFLQLIGDRAHLHPNLLTQRFLERIAEKVGTGALHQLGEIYLATPWVDIDWQMYFGLENPTEPLQPPFKKWAHVPRAIAVTLVVPKERWQNLSPGGGFAKNDHTWGAKIACHVRVPKRFDMAPKVDAATIYMDMQVAFGNVTTVGSPDQDDFALVVQEDKAGWKGTSPMVLSFYAPADLLETMYLHGTVGFSAMFTRLNPEGYEEISRDRVFGYERSCFDCQHVFLTKYQPGHTGYTVTERTLRVSAKPQSRAEDGQVPGSVFTANFDSDSTNIITITGRLNVTSDKGKQLLAAMVPVETKQVSPFTINFNFGKTPPDLVLPITFPVPIVAKGSKTRVSRKWAYFEVDALLARPLASPTLDDFLFPTTLLKPCSIPATLNIPHINLDSLPILALEDKSRTRFLTTLTSLTFSSRERRLREQLLMQQDAGKSGASSISNDDNTPGGTGSLTSPAPAVASARLNFKESLFTIFMLTSGLQGGQTGLFAITHPQRGGIHMLLFASAVRLDGAHGSVVLDAAALPLTKRLVDSGELEAFLLILRTLECCTLTVDDEELALWKRALPALAERCRTWAHDPVRCEYARAGASLPLSLREGEQVLCSCGQGKLPPDFIPLPEWDVAARYATRVAISPVYASALVEELVDPALAKAVAQGKALAAGDGDLLKACRNCGKTEEVEGVKLKKCLRCLQVVYCSAECQKKDWKKHRMECEESEVYEKQ